MAKNKNDSRKISETYIVRYDIQGEDGYWKNNQEVDIKISVPSNKEKNAHDLAEAKFMEMFLGKNVSIVCCTYC